MASHVLARFQQGLRTVVLQGAGRFHGQTGLAQGRGTTVQIAYYTVALQRAQYACYH
jgi:hypothetical protein